MKRALGRRMQFSTMNPTAEADMSRSPAPAAVEDGARHRRPDLVPRPAFAQSDQEITAPTASAGIGFDDLMFTEKFLLWGARLWWTLGQARQESLSPLAEAFRISRARPALGPFDAVMTVLAIQARAPLKIKPVRSKTLSQDERRLLFLIAARPGPIRDAVSAHLLPCCGTTLMRPLLAQLNDALSDAGMFLPRRVWDFPEVLDCIEDAARP